MISGIALAAKGLKPGIKVVAAEPTGSNNAADIAAAKAAGEIVACPKPKTIADGLQGGLLCAASAHLHRSQSAAAAKKNWPMDEVLLVWSRCWYACTLHPAASCCLMAPCLSAQHCCNP